MKIVFDTSRSKKRFDQHGVRGSGFYYSHLFNSLLENFPEDHFYEFKGGKLTIKPDAIHIPFFEPFFLSLPLKKKAKTVVTVHDLIPILYPDHFPSGLAGSTKWFFQKNLLLKMDKIITDSDSSKKDIVNLIGVNPEKVSVVYLAADKIFKREIISDKVKFDFIKRHNLPRKFFVYVGDVTWNKNLINITEAVKLSGVNCVFVGKSLVDNDFDKGNKWNRDRVLIKDALATSKNCFLTGFLSNEDLSLIYNLATALIMPSFYEGFGLPVLEAMQSGCPVITSKEGSLPEITQNAAFYVNPIDVGDLKKAIQVLEKNNDVRNSLIEKGFRVSKKFSWASTADKMMSIYRSLYEA